MRRWLLAVCLASLAACAVPPARHGPAETGVSAWVSAGEAALARGEVARAETLLEQALRVAPRDPAAWQALARLREAQGRVVEARRLRLRACRLAGACP